MSCYKFQEWGLWISVRCVTKCFDSIYEQKIHVGKHLYVCFEWLAYANREYIRKFDFNQNSV